MRRVSRQHVNIPDELVSQSCKQHLRSIIGSPGKKPLSKHYRGLKEDANGTREYTVVKSLKDLYKNKCAYCERWAHDPQIDHHRPKGEVEGATNDLGYYWLCYEWTNLLPACADCNGLQAKAQQYPILIPANRRCAHPTTGAPPVPHYDSFVYSSVYNRLERPLLIHPEFCDPSIHFRFDKAGRIFGKTPQGRATVNVVKLDREDLNGCRREIYEGHLSELQSIVRKRFRANNPIKLSHFEECIEEWTLNLAVEAFDDSLQYTLYRKFLLYNIDTMFIGELQEVFRPTVTEKIRDALNIITQLGVA